MLHSCFQLLVDFIEKEKGDFHCNYEANKDLVDEYRFLYNWWKEYTKSEKIDEDLEQEMLERLIKIRRTLWT